MEWINEKPWNSLGVDINPNLSPREMVYKLKLDLETSWNPTGGVRPGRPKSYANQEAFQFFKSFTEHGNSSLETIGTLDNGRIVWALANLKEDFTLMKVDKLKGYLLLSSRNENRDKIEIYFIMVRLASNNTLHLTSKARTSFTNICRRPFSKQFPFVSLESHKFEGEVVRKTKEAIGYGREAISSFFHDAERLTKIKIDEQVAIRYMLNVFQPDMVSKLTAIGSKDVKAFADKKTELGIEAIKKAPGHNLESADMTAWGLLNAVTYIIDHHLGNSQDSRLRISWFGSNAKLKQKALALALKL